MAEDAEAGGPGEGGGDVRVLREGGLDGGEVVVVTEVVGDGVGVAVVDGYGSIGGGLVKDGGVIAVLTDEADEGAGLGVFPVEDLAAGEGGGEIEGVGEFE